MASDPMDASEVIAACLARESDDIITMCARFGIRPKGARYA
jgi:hypothetical protein